MKRKTTLLVMAAGMGSRFGSLKQITPLGPHQKALLHYTIYDAVHAGFDKIVFVIRESFAKEFIDFVGKYAEGLVETAYCYQSMDKLPGGMPPIEREKPWGTAHAIWSAKEVIDEPFAALNADDFYGSDAFVKAHDFLANEATDQEFGLVGYRLASTLSEFYSPKVVDKMIKDQIADVRVLKTTAKWFGVTYKEDTPSVNAALAAFDKEGKYLDI